MNTPILPPLRSKHSKIISWFTGTAAALAVTLCMSPVAKAQAVPNGDYEYLSTTGSLTIAGRTITVSTKQSFLLSPEGNIVIQNNNLKFSAKKSASLVKLALTKLKLLSNVETTVTGPNQILMAKKVNSYVGVIASPITINFNGVSGATIASGRIKLSPRAKVRNGILVITVPVGGIFTKSGKPSLPIDGSITIQARLIP